MITAKPEFVRRPPVTTTPSTDPPSCEICHGPGLWRYDGVDHTGQVDGGCCYDSWTCVVCGGTRYQDYSCPEHTEDK